MLDARSVGLSEKRLEKARREYEGATFNKEAGFFDIANTRAYYAVFHSIRAVLALDGIDFKTHGQAIGYFNKNYVNAGLVDRSLGEVIKGASKSRNNSDYEDYYISTLDEAEKNIDGAKRFLAAVEKHIEARLEANRKGDEEYSQIGRNGSCSGSGEGNECKASWTKTACSKPCQVAHRPRSLTRPRQSS